MGVPKRRDAKWKNEYNDVHYDRLYPAVKKGKKEKYKAAADAAGLSLNEWVERTLDAAAGIDYE